MKLDTPLSRVLGLGTAKSGVEHWWVQRLTAVALVPLVLWLAWSLQNIESLSYPSIVAWMQSPITAVLLIATLLAGIYHSYLGIQVVVEDYVHAHGVKLLSLVSSALGHAFLLIAAVYSVLAVAFGA